MWKLSLPIFWEKEMELGTDNVSVDWPEDEADERGLGLPPLRVNGPDPCKRFIDHLDPTTPDFVPAYNLNR